MKKLSPEEIQQELKSVEGWSAAEGRDAITKTFKFKNFRAAWTFMEDVAVEADEMSHHPEWTNIYSTVTITLTTHDAGGVTELDFDLAAFINSVEKVVQSEEF